MSYKVPSSGFTKSTKKMKKSEFIHPLVVNVNGSPFSLNGETHDGFDELSAYLCREISRNEQGVRKFCDDNYELLGYTWYELMHTYLNKDYGLIVDLIADIYTDYIWNSCFAGGKFDWDRYFDIHAEYESGGYGVGKMKKSHGDYMDAIENFIVDDCPNGCYYNEIYDAFSDALDEDDIMDAIATLEDDGIIRYNENNEKYEVCAKGVRKSRKEVKKDMDIYSPPSGRFCVHRSLNGESFYPKYYDDEGRFSQVCQDLLDSGYEEREGDRHTDENGMTHRYFERWDKSVDKSYSPNYVGFRDMVSKMRSTRDNTKIFKE